MPHHLSASPETVHWGYFDAETPPVLTVEPGETVTIDAVSGGHPIIQNCPYPVLPDHKEIVETVMKGPGPHILTGPVAINGAKAGDVLEVEILDIQFRQDWGWNWFRPLWGALPDDFPYQRILYTPIDRAKNEATLQWGPKLPMAPFFGITGVAPPPAWGQVSTVEPRANGGNIDCKEFTAGSRLFFPVFNDGALFSCGDGHGCQGDGEVCLTGLETALKGTFRFQVHKSFTLERPMAVTPKHLITLGIDPDLDDAATMALKDMIAMLVRLKGWSAEDAYIFCSLACDLHVTQIVDLNKGVHAMVARDLIEPFEIA